MSIENPLDRLKRKPDAKHESSTYQPAGFDARNDAAQLYDKIDADKILNNYIESGEDSGIGELGQTGNNEVIGETAAVDIVAAMKAGKLTIKLWKWRRGRKEKKEQKRREEQRKQEEQKRREKNRSAR